MTNQLRVGVVGVGYLGSIHAAIYARMPNVELVSVCDVDSERAEEIAAKTDSQPCTDFNQLVGKLDAVSIVVPTSLHRTVAEPFLNAGTHMLLEKPVASTVADAQAIVDCAERSGAILQIGHIERFNAGVMELASRVRDPRFIEVHRLGVFVERATDVDVITDLMIHDIDIVLNLVKSGIKRVSAVGSTVVTDHVDIANARLEFENGAVANVTASRVSAKKFRRIRVFCPDQYIGLDFDQQKLDVVTTREASGDARFPEIVTDQVEVEKQPPLDAELDHFVETVQTGSKPLVTGREGVAALSVAMKVHSTLMG